LKSLSRNTVAPSWPAPWPSRQPPRCRRPAKSDVDTIKDAADALAAMARKHGGRFRTTVNHEAGFILIALPIGKGGGA
jgi:hypothetical protein